LRHGPPRTFNHKIVRRMHFERDPRFPLRSDKVLVKDFVAGKLGARWITPTLWHGPALPALSDRTWPLPFVLKASHGSHWNIFVREPYDLNWAMIEDRCRQWLTQIYGPPDPEWLYTAIQPQLLVEPFFGAGSTLPVDYKLWTFHGRVEFIQVDIDRESAHKRVFFDCSWNRLPFNIGRKLATGVLKYPTDLREITRPKSLDAMIEAATTLVEDIAFVRVDFYDVNGE